MPSKKQSHQERLEAEGGVEGILVRYDRYGPTETLHQHTAALHVRILVAELLKVQIELARAQDRPWQNL